MAHHSEIDQRSLKLAQAVCARIDADPSLLTRVRAWAARRSEPAYQEWAAILKLDWPQVRTQLLREDDEGQRLRQSSPFVGILTARERWGFYR